MQLPYSRKGKKLTLNSDQWTIETLTDSSLVIFLARFRRMTFLSEEYLQTKEKFLQPVGEYKGKPLYKANRIITPRYNSPTGFREDILKQDRSDDYNIHKAGFFRMSFIVTDEGRVKQPKIITSVTTGYDNGVVKELLKTKHWTPAKFNGYPVQALVLFEVEFLDSIVEH